MHSSESQIKQQYENEGWMVLRNGWPDFLCYRILPDIEQGQAARLAMKLETLRRPADLWIMDEYGVKIETIGGCEYAPDIADDKRIKWNWWYDKTVVGLK